MPRNNSGTYTLPAGNPVVVGTLIEASWANDTLNDLASAMTDSLSRNGEGGMLASFRLADGTLGAPGLAFTNETSTGFYRASAGTMWGVVSGSQILQYTTNGVLIPSGKTLTAQGNATVGGTLGVTGAATLSSTLAVTGAITATGGVVGNVTGNASTVTNGVYTTGTYADPAWITALAGSKITGAIDNVTIGQTTAAAGSFTTLSASTSASLTVLTSTGLTKLGASTGSESLRVSSTSAATNYVRVYGAATGSGPVIDAQGADTNVDLSLSPKGAGALNLYGNVALIGGTANGVLYLNGSKVATSGSALVFDGTNLGLGVTPSAWGGSYKAIQFASGAIAGFSTTALDIYGNAYDSGAGAWKYLNSSQGATRYAAFNGSHQWFNAPTGTAGNAITFTQAMTLDASGNLGVGTTSPGQIIEASKSQNGDTAIQSTNVSTSGAATAQFFASNGTTKTQFFHTGTSYTSSGILNAAGLGGVYNTTTSGLAFISDNASGTIKFATGGLTERARITSVGDVGIGTNSPALAINPSTRALSIYQNTTDGAGIGLQSSNCTFNLVAGNDATYISNESSDPLLFRTNGTERARITSGGDLLLNTTNAAINAGEGIKLLNDSSKHVSVVSSLSTNGGGEAFVMYSTVAGAYRFYVGWGGTIYATNTTISAISDQRFKENIQDLDVGLNAIMALKPRKFDWKAGKGKDKKNDRGFIAQEFEQVFPDLIDEWKDPAPEGEEPYKSVRQDLIPVLVKAIQEQQTIIQSLTARIAALESKGV